MKSWRLIGVLIVLSGTLVMLGATAVGVPAWAAEGEVSPPTTLSPGASCLSSSCHQEFSTRKYVHAPAADGSQCGTCHRAADPAAHEFELAAKRRELCAGCHEFDTTAQNLHGPFKSKHCLRCHDPHASDNRKVTRLAQPELCFQCHKKQLKDTNGKALPAVQPLFDNENVKLHRPVQKGKCTTCHKPHYSPNFRLLKNPYPESFYAPYSKKAYLCLKCHRSKAFESPRTLSDTAFRNGNLNLHYRHVNREKGRTCRACHHHHGAARPKLIRGSVPFGERAIVIDEFELTETGGACGPTCHGRVEYDRLDPAAVPFKVSPREGEDASPEELAAASASGK